MDMIMLHRFSVTWVGKLNYSQVTMQYMYYYKSVCVCVGGEGGRKPKYADRNEELFALTKTGSAYDDTVYVLLKSVCVCVCVCV